MPRARKVRRGKPASAAAGSRNSRDLPNGTLSERPDRPGALNPLRNLILNSSDAVISESLTGAIQSWDEGAERVYGYSTSEILGKSVAILDPEGAYGTHRAILSEVGAGRTVSHLATTRLTKGGGVIHVDLSASPIRDADGKVIGVSIAARDLSQRRSVQNCLRSSRQEMVAMTEVVLEAKKKFEILSASDALTGLANRSSLDERMEHILAMAQYRGRKIAVLFLNLDRFKLINDARGHAVGDRVLKAVARRLTQMGRDVDIVARVGGDEFVLAMEIDSIKDAQEAADLILGKLSTPIAVGRQKLHISASIGISLYPKDGAHQKTLIRYADQAMYAAKENGPNTYRFFSAELNEEIQRRATMEHDLRAAIDRDEFFLSYQPQMTIQTGELAGLEALLRWNHPVRGLVDPNLFISIAETSGLILPIGEYVLRTACRQARKWLDQGLLLVPMAVNISAVQFRQANFCHLVASLLEETGLPAQLLELELTESLLLANRESTLDVLKQLRDMGVQLAIDDFGTGYSSLSYLKQFHVHKLKIDSSFVRDIPEDSAITRAIIDMGKNLNLRVIAEGVEDQGQLRFLRNHRCDEIQGYIFSRPLPAAKMESFLLERSGTDPAEGTAAAGQRLPMAELMAS